MEGVPRFVGGRGERIGHNDGGRIIVPNEDGSLPAQARDHVLRPARGPIEGGRRRRRTALRPTGGGHGAGRVHAPAEELLRPSVTGGKRAREKWRKRKRV
jgi:hypothetical protein